MEPYRRLWGLLGARWPLVLLAVGFSTLSGATSASYALFAGYVAELVLGERAVDLRAFGADAGALATYLVVPAAAITVVRSLSVLIASWASNKVGYDVAHELRVALYARVASGALPRTLPHHRGDLVARLHNDVSVVQWSLASLATSLIYVIMSTVLVAGVMVSLDPVLGLMAALGVPLVYVVLRATYRHFNRQFASLREGVGMLDARVEEIVDVGDVVRSLGAEQRMTERFARLSAEARDVTQRVAWLSTVSRPIVTLAGVAGLVLAYFTLGVGRDAAFQASLLAAGAILVRPLQGASELFEGLSTVRSSLQRVDELLRVPLKDTSGSDAADMRSLRQLEARKLGFAYDERPALTGVSFTLQRGRVLAVVGVSGAGKTTLLKVVAGLLGSYTGELRVDGRLVDPHDERAYRRLFGWVPQEPRLLIGTVRDNVTLGEPAASEAELERVLRAAGIWDAVRAMPEGLDTMVRDDGAPFSVGQRQRLCIARALITGAPVLILDEPTAALDELQAEALHVTLDGLREHVAVLVATHRLSSVRRADSVLVLDQGRVVEQGTMLELVKGGQHLRKIFARELRAN